MQQIMRNECIIEMLTPKQSAPDIERALQRVAERYRHITGRGCNVSIPDNPMGALRFQATEVIAELQLPLPPGQVLIHLNTFHTKSNLDEILGAARTLGARKLLVVSGDGGRRLTRLDPADLGTDAKTVTSIELLRYIRNAHPGAFRFGVAFNPYEPVEQETAKLREKVEAGAEFVITQPVIGSHTNLDRLETLGMPVFVGAWMSQRLDMLANCVGCEIHHGGSYDPIANAKTIRKRYPRYGLYFCVVDLETQLDAIKEMLA